MKIKNKKDVEVLDQKIRQELGVDLSKYRNQEVTETLLDLLIFPKYAIWWVGQCVLVSFFLYIIGFFVVELVHIQYVIYAILGLIFFLINGVIAGLLFLVYKIRVDISMICEYAFKIMKECVADLKMVKSNGVKKNVKGTLPILFAGIIHIIIIPSVTTAISNKLRIVGYLINGLIRKILTLIASKVKFESIEWNDNEQSEEMEDSKLLSRYYKSIEKASNGIIGIVKIITSVVRVPIMIVFFFTASLLSLFLLLIW